jgi:hypothetical protein
MADVKTVNGLAFASVKTKNGLAIASVKSINGVDAQSTGGPSFVTASAPFFGTLQGDITVQFTLGATASNGYVVAAIAYYDTLIVTFSAPTCDGVTMDLIDDHVSSGDSLYKLALYGLEIGNKTAGTYDVFFDVTNNNFQSVFAGAAVYNDVDQTTSFGTPSATDGTSTTPSTTVSSATGEIVVGFCATFDDTANPTPGAGQTERIGDADVSGGNFGFSDEAGSASTTHSYTVVSNPWIICGVALKP